MRKNQRLEVRLTEADEAVLDARRGNLNRSEWLRRQIHYGHHTVTQEAPAVVELDDDPPVKKPKKREIEVIPQGPGNTTTHRHRGEVVAERTVKGVKTVTLKCTVEGCTRTWER